MSFIPRTTWHLPKLDVSWYPGHMAKAMRLMKEQLARDRELGIVIEVRDARIPMTSVNANLESLFKGAGARVNRIIVHTKRDLADPRYEDVVNQAIESGTGRGAHRGRSFFVDTSVDGDVRAVIDHAKEVAHAYRPSEKSKILVVGMPNVGKSSLLNALRRVGVRKGKSARTGALPGITRKVTGTVIISHDPTIHIYDSPGVMYPNLVNSELLMRIALTAGIKETLVSSEEVADYLLYRLNQLNPDSYLDRLGLPGPTNSIQEALISTAERTGKRQVGGVLNLEAAAMFFIRSYRHGLFGRFTLDDVGLQGEGYAKFLETGQILERTADEPDPESRNQKKKKLKEEAAIKREVKWARIQAEHAAT